MTVLTRVALTGGLIVSVLGVAAPAEAATAYAVSLTPTPSTVEVGRPFGLLGSVSPAASGTVQIQRYSGGAWRPYVAPSLDSRSRYSRAVTAPSSPTTLRLRAVKAGADGHSTGVSASVLVRVVTQHYEVAATFPGTVTHGRHFLVPGRLSPASEGSRVVLQHRVGSDWRPLSTTTSGADGAFTLTAPAPDAAETYRVFKAASGTLAQGLSPAASPALAESDRLGTGAVLSVGDFVLSSDQRFRLVMQGDGNLVVYGPSGAAWNSGTSGSGAWTVMQGDGNLVVYGQGGPLWSSGTVPTRSDQLIMQSDGNLVIHDNQDRLIWVNGVRTGNLQDTLAAGYALGTNQSLTSSDGRFDAVMQGDGNVVVYQTGGVVKWASSSSTTNGALAMQGDGNLVVYGPSGAVWSSGTNPSSGDRLVMQSDGNLVIYDGANNALWVNGTRLGGGSVPVVGTPTWWNGDCDSGGYAGARRLGAVWHGLIACGPRPLADGANDRLVRFFPNAWGEYEWECVELSMRWMYQAYGVKPYSANGNGVVPNYSTSSGGGLVRISNGTAGRPPVPGDVIGFNTGQFGHTGVVTSTSVDGAGNGTVTIIDQNASANGSDTYRMTSWSVSGSNGWLHKP